MRTGRARAVATRARLVAQAERGGRVRVVRGQGRREAELEQHAPLAHEERVGELRRWDGGTVRGAVVRAAWHAAWSVLRGTRVRMLVPGAE